MGDTGFSVDQNPGRWLIGTAGAILCEAGVQAMLTSQATPLRVLILITGTGVTLILVAVFWNRVGLQKVVFFERLNKIASHPGLWIALITVVWFTSQTLEAIREIRINNEIAALRNDEQSISRVIDRGVLPRRLTKRQQSTISSFLSEFDPHEFSFHLPPRDMEAESYRGDIEQAFRKGGWTLSTKDAYVYSDNVPEGLSVELILTQEHAQTPRSAANPSADRLIMMALGLAGVRLTQSGSTNGGPTLTQDRVEIDIGRRRMDSFEFTTPEPIF